MARRFITVEDVRRHRGGDLVVDDNTIVTPQALDAAEAAGIAVRQAGGEYSEPTPDRGPDADRAQASLPHLPEPETDTAGDIGLVVTAVGRNRPGVLAEITEALARMNVSVENISQRMIDEYFHLVITASLTQGTRFEELKAVTDCLGGKDDYVVRVMHERVFSFMHRI